MPSYDEDKNSVNFLKGPIHNPSVQIMFGNLGNGQASNAFGNTSDTNQSAKRNMFGTLTATPQADQGNKTFGNVSFDEPSAKNNIYGNLTGT